MMMYTTADLRQIQDRMDHLVDHEGLSFEDALIQVARERTGR